MCSWARFGLPILRPCSPASRPQPAASPPVLVRWRSLAAWTPAARGRGRRFAVSKAEEASILHIYNEILDWLEQVAPLVTRIAKYDRDLSRQLKRSSCSVALSTAEGMYAYAGSRRQAYSVALREMRESYAALEIGMRLRYIAPLDAAFEDRCQKILGTLVRLSVPRRR